MVRARYGLGGIDARTLEQVGHDLDLTRERVRQIELKALHKLRQPYRNYMLRDYTVGDLFVEAGVLNPAGEAVAAAMTLIADAESSWRVPRSTGTAPYSEGKGKGKIIDVGLDGGSMAFGPLRRTCEIESTRESLDRAWNAQSVADIEKLERELEESEKLLRRLEEQGGGGGDGGIGEVVGLGQESLSMASYLV